MELFLELLKITLPGGLIVWVVYIMLKRQPIHTPDSAVEKKNHKATLELRLKAYERLTLFMERIAPEKIIQRQLSSKMTCSQLQMNLLETIRKEFDHNLTQQLYVSDEAWQAIVIAKESVIQLINTSKNAIKDDALAIDYSRVMIDAYHRSEETPTDNAIKQLKKEVIALLS